MPELIFKGQTRVRLILDTDVDFSANTVTTALIMWTDPDGVAGQWTATLLTPLTDGKIFVDFTSVINFTKSGKWRLWPHLTFSDLRIAPGQEYVYDVPDQGMSMG